MTMVDPTDPIGEARYWTAVRETLRHLYDADPRLADHYRRRLEDAEPQERLLVYHNEPLDVAADLAGRRVTADDVWIYQQRVLTPLLQREAAGLSES